MQLKEMSKDYYYWQEKDDLEMIGNLKSKIAEYYDFLDRSGLFSIMDKSYRAYYGGKLDSKSSGIFDSTELSREGKQGELVYGKANHYSNVTDHTVQLTTSNKPAFQCRATNSDYKSLSQAALGTCIIDYYWREKKLTGMYVDAALYALLFGEASIHRPWDKSIGNSYVADPVKNAVTKEGDIKAQLCTPLDVIRRVDAKGIAESEWKIVRTFANRWDLIARNPELKDELLSVSDSELSDSRSFMFRINSRDNQEHDSDQVIVWTAMHQKTDAMPKGRLFVFAGEVKLYDGPIPYEDIPIDFVHPRKLIGTPFGFSPQWQLMGIQQMLDILTSTIITNQSTNGVNNLWTKNKDPVSITNLAGGMKNMQSEEMPQVLRLVDTAPEIFNFRQTLIGEVETLSGINSTVRGNPEASLKSGSSLALVVAQAVQFASMFEGSLLGAQEETATGIIVTLRDFSKSTRVANIIGAANRSFRKEFTPDKDLAAIARVVIEPVNPLSKTISGRLQLAENMIAQGMVKTPQQYLTVLQTGQLDPLMESSGSFEMLNIRAEGENLRENKTVIAIISDLHESHIVEHMALLATPEAREDPQFAIRVLSHVADHEAKWQELSSRPALLMATKQQPFPAPQTPMMPPPGAPQGAGPLVEAPQDPAMMQGQGEQPNMPSMPSLPPGTDPNSQEAYAQTIPEGV